MQEYNSIDVLINQILADLQRLKAERLKSLHMQDFNVDIIQKKTKGKSQVNAILGEQSLEDFIFNNKYTMSKFMLKRRAKKIYKMQKTIEKGYISAVDKSIAIVEKAYKDFFKDN